MQVQGQRLGIKSTLVHNLCRWIPHIKWIKGQINSNFSTREKYEYAFIFSFPATNNVVEYEVILTGPETCKTIEAKSVRVFNSSQLLVSQVKGEFKATGNQMAIYLPYVKESIKGFLQFEITYLARSNNHQPITLSKLASSQIDSRRLIFWEVIRHKYRLDRVMCHKYG